MKSKFFALAVIVVLTAMLTVSLVAEKRAPLHTAQELERHDRAAAEAARAMDDAVPRDPPAATQPTTMPAHAVGGR